MSAQGITSAAEKHIAAPRRNVARILEMFGITLARPQVLSVEQAKPVKKQPHRHGYLPTTSPEPLITVSGGHRKVVLDDNWCGVVRRDYNVTERKPLNEGCIKLFD